MLPLRSPLKHFSGGKEAAPAGAEQHKDADKHHSYDGADGAEHRGLALHFTLVEHHAPRAVTRTDDPGYVAAEPQCLKLVICCYLGTGS